MCVGGPTEEAVEDEVVEAEVVEDVVEYEVVEGEVCWDCDCDSSYGGGKSNSSGMGTVCRWNVYVWEDADDDADAVLGTSRRSIFRFWQFRGCGSGGASCYTCS